MFLEHFFVLLLFRRHFLVITNLKILESRDYLQTQETFGAKFINGSKFNVAAILLKAQRAFKERFAPCLEGYDMTRRCRYIYY